MKSLLIGVILLLGLPCSRTVDAQSKPILIGIKVEAEGGGNGQGMWVQESRDLTPAEVKSLESLVTAEIKKEPNVKIVSMDYPEDFIGVVVVAAKLPAGDKWYYVGSSVVTVATKKGIDELVTHDVLAATDLVSLSHMIGYQFASARLRAAAGLWK